jgi:hypothetical protein
MSIFVKTIRRAKTTGMPPAGQQILRAGMPLNKSYALECRATNPSRWNATQTNPTRWNAAQQILRTEMPLNKSYALECRATNPTCWNAAQQNPTR